MKYRVTRTYWKDVIVEANNSQEAREKASMECLFDDAKLMPSDIDDVEEIEEED